jgi:hypothetical protein
VRVVGNKVTVWAKFGDFDVEERVRKPGVPLRYTALNVTVTRSGYGESSPGIL